MAALPLLVGAVGLALVALVVWDAFETMVLPRRVTRRLRLTRLFYVLTWRPWAAIGRCLPPSPRREPRYINLYTGQVQYGWGGPRYFRGQWNGGSFGPCWTYTPIGMMPNCK